MRSGTPFRRDLRIEVEGRPNVGPSRLRTPDETARGFIVATSTFEHRLHEVSLSVSPAGLSFAERVVADTEIPID